MKTGLETWWVPGDCRNLDAPLRLCSSLLPIKRRRRAQEKKRQRGNASQQPQKGAVLVTTQQKKLPKPLWATFSNDLPKEIRNEK